MGRCGCAGGGGRERRRPLLQVDHSAGMWDCRAHTVVTDVVYCMYCFDMTPPPSPSLPLPPPPSLYSCGCLAMSWQTRSVYSVLMTSTSSAVRRRSSSSGPWKRHSPANLSSPNSSYTSEIRSATLCTTVHYTCTCTLWCIAFSSNIHVCV